MALTAKPDGYTIAQFPMGMLRVPHMQKMQWDPLKDFTFILGVSGYTFGLTVRADSPYKTFNEYIEAARKSPGKIDYGSTGVGTSPHLLMEELAANAKVTLNHVPFKGNADLQQALLGGHVMAQSDATRLGQVRRRRPDAPARHLRREAHQALAERADGAGARLRRRLDLAVRLRRPEGHGPGGRRRRCTTPSRRRWTIRKHLELLDQLNQDAWYRSGDDYAKWARETFAKDKLLIERLGLAAKS